MNYELRIKEKEEKVIPFVWINDKRQEDVQVILEDGASVKILGIFLGTGNHAITFNTTVVHKGKNTKSMTDLRGVFFHNASFNNDGMVRIDKGAKGADGYFKSKILLFDNAKGRSVPSLEIDESDLKAGHASTVGRPEAEQLFYLKSRGLSEKEAEKLIVAGFFEPLLQQLPENQRRAIRKKIAKTL